MSVVGYYITCDDAVCEDCAPAGFNEGDYSQWEGFESWEEPICIFRDEESDTPTHCKTCGELIPHALTKEGVVYVEDAAWEDLHWFATKRRTPSARSVKVVHAWLEKYQDYGDMNAIVINLHNALYESMVEGGYYDEEEQ